MATVQALRARVGAARLVLDAEKGKPSHLAMSKLQASALVDMCSGTTASNSEKADVAVELVKLPWASPNDLQDGLAILMPTGPPAQKRRRQLQHFAAIHAYGSETFWQRLSSSMVPPVNKLQTICQQGLSLGLRLPSEHTFKWMNTIWIASCHSPDVIAQMSPDQKVVYLKHTKATYDGLRRSSAEPVEWVEELPSDPLDVLRKSPRTFAYAFPGDEKPVASSLDGHVLMAINQSCGCRGGVSRISFAAKPTAPAVSSDSGSLQMSPRRHGSYCLRV